MNLLKFFNFTKLNVIDCSFNSEFTLGVSILRHLQTIHYPNIEIESAVMILQKKIVAFKCDRLFTVQRTYRLQQRFHYGQV